MRPVKIKRDEPIEVGSIVKFKNTDRVLFVGEVLMLYGTKDKQQAEIMLYDKRFRPNTRADGSFIRKRVSVDRCKHIDPDFKFDTSNDFELGDVVCRSGALRKRFGVIVGFRHPDELTCTSYESGYNGTDLIQCVEIHKRGLDVKKDWSGHVKRFECGGHKLKMCEVDLWCRAGPKIIIK